MSETKYTHGKFVWRELITTDIEASKRFYGELFNWKITKSPMEAMDYFLCNAGEAQVAGMFQLDKPGVPSHWEGYVSVPDVDAAIEAAKSAGGTLLNGPMDIPNIGRMANLADPQGGVFAVYKNAIGGDHPTSGRPGVGQFCWEQLNTTDVEGAKAFYAKVAGWRVVSMGPGMDIFATQDAENNGVASFMAPPPGVPTHWLTYVVVTDLAETNARATRLGAKVMMDRIDVPTVGSFSVLQDPTGAFICAFQGLAA